MSITVRANSSTVRICISESGFDDCVRVIGFCFIQIIFSIVNSIDDMIPKSRISTLVQKLVFAHKKSRSADSTFIMSKVPHVPQLTPVRFLCVNQLRQIKHIWCKSQFHLPSSLFQLFLQKYVNFFFCIKLNFCFIFRLKILIFVFSIFDFKSLKHLDIRKHFLLK